PGGGSGGSDVSGNKLTNAPETSAALGATYFRDLPGMGATLLLRGDVTHKGEFYTTADNTSTTTYNSAFPGTIEYGLLKERTEINARIGLMSDNDTWEVYAWGRNLTDETDPQDELRDFFGT